MDYSKPTLSKNFNKMQLTQFTTVGNKTNDLNTG
jgi:hypothetical protein